MPRNPDTGEFERLEGSQAGPPLTTISSATFNALVDDLVAGHNEARPIAAGGTGATTPAEALANLLDGSELTGPQGPEGPAGPAGPKGDKGDPGDLIANVDATRNTLFGGPALIQSLGGTGAAALADALVTPTGGTAVRTLADKLGETLSAKDFGAHGDGTTDDTTAMTAFFGALNVVGGGVKGYIPKGTYMISQINIDVVCDISIECHPQAVIKGIATSGDGVNDWMLEFDCEHAGTSLHVHKISWQGGKLDNSARTLVGAQESGTALRLRGFRQVNVTGLHVYGGDDYEDGNADTAIAVLKNEQVSIYNNVIEGQSDEGFYIRFCENIAIRGNHFIKCANGVRHSAGGSKFICDGNTFTKCRSGVGVIDTAETPARKVVIANNIFEDMKTRCIDARLLKDGDVIANNNMTDWGYDLSGARVEGTDLNWGAINLLGCDGTLVVGNNITFRERVADTNHRGIAMNWYDPEDGSLRTETTNCVLIGNKIDAASGALNWGFRTVTETQTTGHHFYLNRVVATIPYAVDNSCAVYSHEYATHFALSRTNNSAQSVRIFADAESNRMVGVSETGNPKLFILESDDESTGLQLQSRAGDLLLQREGVTRIRITALGAEVRVPGPYADDAAAATAGVAVGWAYRRTSDNAVVVRAS